MSNTSNRWKSQGGINRRAANNILSNNKNTEWLDKLMTKIVICDVSKSTLKSNKTKMYGDYKRVTD